MATTGAIHLHLWAMGYRTIPTIGPLFLFQGLAGAAMAVLLVVSRRLVTVVTAAGFMVVTIGGFLLSIYGGLFGFMDTLAAPFAGVSLGVESAGAVILTVVGTVLVLGHSHSAQRRSPPSGLASPRCEPDWRPAGRGGADGSAPGLRPGDAVPGVIRRSSRNHQPWTADQPSASAAAIP